MNVKRFDKNTLIFAIIGIIMISWGISGIYNYYSPNKISNDWYSDVPFQKGVSFTTWGAHSFNSTEANQEFLKMKENGVRWVCVNMWYFQSNLTSHDIHFMEWSDTYQNMSDCFNYARSIGLHILYKPMLNLDVYEWRSYINFSTEWMNAYTDWMLNNAIAAENGSAEILSIGCEMGNMQVHSDAVRDMIAQIREVYSGMLTYSANHDSFWDIDWYDALDIIGVSMYAMMTTDFNPTISELKNVWDGYYYKLEALSNKWNKPILFTETGAQALDGSNMIPNDNKISKQKDVIELRDIYLSLFKSRIWTAPWFKGVYWWIWDFYEPDLNHPELDTGFSPEIPVVLETLSNEYLSDHNYHPSNTILLNLVSLIFGIIMFLIFLYRPDFDSNEVLNKRNKKNQDRKENIIREWIINNDKDVQFSLIFSSLVYIAVTVFSIDVFSVIYSSFSLSVILGISPTQVIIVFMIILLISFFIGLFGLKINPKIILISIFLLLLGYPYAFLGDLGESAILKNFFDLVVFFLLIAGTINHLKNFGINIINNVFLITSLTLCVLFLSGLIFDQFSLGLLIIPIGLAGMKIKDKKNKRINNRKLNDSDVGDDSEKNKPSRPFLSISNSKKHGYKEIERIIIIISLIIGILIPIGVAEYNLINMNYLTLILYYIPPILICSVLAVISVYLKNNKEEVYKTRILILFNIKSVLYSGLIIAFLNLPFVIFGLTQIPTMILSGIILFQYLGMLFIQLDKSTHKEKIGRAFIMLFIVLLLFLLGFIVNGIKGIFIIQMTFLDFQNGQFVTRTDFTTIPENLPQLVKVFYLMVCISIFIILIIYRKIYSKFNQKIKF